jgi:hypothetical protein
MSNQINMSLLDKSIDDIEDLAGFETPVPGIYTLKFSTSLKQVNNKDCVSCDFEVIDCLEQNNPEDAPTKPGTKFNTLHQLENDIALGKLKEMLQPISQHFSVSNLATLVTETCKDLIVAGKVKRRKDKTDPDKFYADVGALTVE